MTQNNTPPKKRVLLIDDNLDLLETLSEFLETKYQMKSFTGAQEALTFLEQNLDIDLIICDYTMPMMSGADFLRNLRKNGLLIPIIFLTGNVSLELAREALRLGAMDILDKPLHPQTLMDIAERVLLLEEARETFYHDRELGSNKKNKMLGILLSGNSERSKRVEGGEN